MPSTGSGHVPSAKISRGAGIGVRADGSPFYLGDASRGNNGKSNRDRSNDARHYQRWQGRGRDEFSNLRPFCAPYQDGTVPQLRDGLCYSKRRTPGGPSAAFANWLLG